MSRAKVVRAAIAAVLFGLFWLPARAADNDTVTVFAAASLADVMPVIAGQYQATGGGKVVFSFAASGQLARQIESSAGADMFISADPIWMDYLEKRALVASATRKDLLGNHLVLVAQKSSSVSLTIAPHFPLAQALGGGRLAIGDPDTVPAGTYARSALTSLGVWDSVVNHSAFAENVRVALQYVTRGEAPLGIVYETDARSDPGVRIVATFPEDSHLPITYPIALTKDAKPTAQKFLDYVEGPQARTVFEKAGFAILGGGR